MDGDARNFGMMQGELLRKEDVGELALSVPPPSGPDPAFLGRLDSVEQDPLAKGDAGAEAGDVDDPARGGRREVREDELDEESVAHMVGAELNLVSVLGQTRRDGHDPGIVEDDVQRDLASRPFAFLVDERLCGGFD